MQTLWGARPLSKQWLLHTRNAVAATDTMDEPHDIDGRTKEDILKVWPEAVWFPWDKPLKGQRVQRQKDDPGPYRYGTLTGEVGRDFREKVAHPDCPCCNCAPEWRGTDSLWIVQWDGLLDGRSSNELAKVFVYAPSLLPLEE